MSLKLTKYRLGELIVQRREKNNNYDVPIRGVSKEGFINPKQQDADTSIYNVFYKNDFVFNPARMELNSIALNLEYEKALCSSLYEIFYIKDESILLPEFLNLHLKNENFTRFCDFIGSGSAREYCRFANISEYEINIPPIEVQQNVVCANRLIQKRIEINYKLIASLQSTAQALYKKTFVDGIDKDHLPDGWHMGTLGEICEISAGGDKPYYFSETKNDAYNIPVFANGIENEGLYGYTNKAKISVPSVTISARGTIGFVCLRTEPYVPIVRLLVCIPKKLISNSVLYLYFMLMNTKLEGDGAVQLQLTAPKFKGIEIMIPNINLINEFDKNVFSILRLINTIKKENEKLTEMLSLLMVEAV